MKYISSVHHRSRVDHIERNKNKIKLTTSARWCSLCARDGNASIITIRNFTLAAYGIASLMDHQNYGGLVGLWETNFRFCFRGATACPNSETRCPDASTVAGYKPKLPLSKF